MPRGEFAPVRFVSERTKSMQGIGCHNDVDAPVMIITFPSRRGPADLPAIFRMGGGVFSVDAEETEPLFLAGGDNWFSSASIRSRALSDIFACLSVFYFCMYVISKLDPENCRYEEKAQRKA